MIGATAINQVILMGRLTRTPELRTTQGGISNCSFTVAVTRNFQNQNGERESDFITCVAWRQTAEFICRNFSKGQLILVEGDLRTRSYDDRNHPDVKHYVTEVFVNNVGFGETKASADLARGGQGGGYQGGYQQGGYNQGGYQQGGYNQGNNYNQNGYGNQGGGQPNNFGGNQGYSAPPPQNDPTVGDLNDFEEVISESDLPF